LADLEDPGPTTSDVVIRPVVVDISTGRQGEPVEMREAETVDLVIHHVDSHGRPVRGFPIRLGGILAEVDEEPVPEGPAPTDLPDDVFHPLTEGPTAEPDPDLLWAVQGMAGPDGNANLRVPRGLQAVLDLANLPSNASFRVRLSRDGPLETEFDPEIGVLDKERREITVVWYRAPTLFARIKSDGDRLPDDARAIISRNANGAGSEEGIEKLPDGRFRSRQLLPDLEYSARAVAEGYEGPELKFTLPEGAVKEITLGLTRERESKKDDDPQEGAP
jgi:hypothetical protein